MFPFILITSSLTDDKECIKINKQYMNSIKEFGGFGAAIYGENKEDAEMAVLLADGILFSGGGDINPLIFKREPDIMCGEIDTKRDVFELSLCRMALEKNIPVLGICRGSQVLNVALGGTVLQNIEGGIKHMQLAPKDEETHSVIVVKNSLLWNILKKDKITVNSFHHQSVEKPASDIIISAKSIDGVTEAIESSHYNFALGVQWHPEHLLYNSKHRAIFKSFVEKAKRFREEKGKNGELVQ